MNVTLTFNFDYTKITVEAFGTSWNISDSVAGTTTGKLSDVLANIEARRRQIWSARLTQIMDLLYCLDLNRVTSPMTLADKDDKLLAYVVPQDGRYVVIPIGLPGWLSTPQCGKQPFEMTAMWQQWLKAMPASPDLKHVEDTLTRLQ